MLSTIGLKVHSSCSLSVNSQCLRKHQFRRPRRHPSSPAAATCRWPTRRRRGRRSLLRTRASGPSGCGAARPCCWRFCGWPCCWRPRSWDWRSPFASSRRFSLFSRARELGPEGRGNPAPTQFSIPTASPSTAPSTRSSLNGKFATAPRVSGEQILQAGISMVILNVRIIVRFCIRTKHFFNKLLLFNTIDVPGFCVYS
jgi:hypothetical protein